MRVALIAEGFIVTVHFNPSIFPYIIFLNGNKEMSTFLNQNPNEVIYSIQSIKYYSVSLTLGSNQA